MSAVDPWGDYEVRVLLPFPPTYVNPHYYPTGSQSQREA